MLPSFIYIVFTLFTFTFTLVICTFIGALHSAKPDSAIDILFTTFIFVFTGAPPSAKPDSAVGRDLRKCDAGGGCALPILAWAYV